MHVLVIKKVQKYIQNKKEKQGTGCLD